MIRIVARLFATASLALITLAAAQDYRLDVTWINHIQAGMVEQDVLIEQEPGSNAVFRVTPENYEMYQDAPAFAAAAPITHDPFNMEAVGPYERGPELGMTLGEWLAGTGTVTLTCEGGQGNVQASFTNLVPDGLYSVWHLYTPMPPTVPFAVIELPLGARDGSQNVFTADAQGNALYSATLESCPPLSTEQLLSALAIAYHSDGQTYGTQPGAFPTVAHVQLVAMFPTPEALAAGN